MNDAIAEQLRRRRTTSRRLSLLACGCTDPWPCRCRDNPAPTGREVDAAAAALTRLDALGVPGLLDRETCRAMYRRGYRRLSAQCATRAGWSS